MRTILLMLCAFMASFGLVAPSLAQSGHTGHGNVTITPDVTFTLRTGIADGKLVFVGGTGAIRGQINPDLKVPEKAVLQLNVIKADGAFHDFAVPEFAASPTISPARARPRRSSSVP